VYFGQSVLYFVVFLAGIVAGSFFDAVGCCYRQGESFRKLFKAGNLFPLFSFILNKGKRCDDTGKGVFSCFHLVEFASAGIFVVCYYFFGLTPGFFKYAVMLDLLLVISIIDLEIGLIPNRIVLWLFFWIFLWQLFYPYLPLESVMIGFLAGGGLFYVIALLSRGGMGGGDIKLMAVLGLAAGWPYVLVVFLLSFILGSLSGLVLLVSKKRALKDSLAFAPFLSLAFFLVTFWGVKIWQWYESFW
jgi:leader peptidase (prepilin peptidase)/N-methyltransferase